MLTVLGDLVRNLVVIIFVNVILELLLPRGQFHRYTRLVTGLIVILMVVSALCALLGRVPEAGFTIPAVAPAAAGVDEQGDRLWLQNQRKALTVYKNTLTQLVREEVEAEGWRFAAVRFTLEEDPTRDNFGMLYGLEVQVQALTAKAGSPVEPIMIEPVEVGPGAASNEGTGSGDLERIPALEQALAMRLQVSGGIIKVVRLN